MRKSATRTLLRGLQRFYAAEAKRYTAGGRATGGNSQSVARCAAVRIQKLDVSRKLTLSARIPFQKCSAFFKTLYGVMISITPK